MVRDITLLCSAAATGLSKTADRLAASGATEVVDLEAVLKSEVFDWGAHPGAPQTMGTICSTSDRDSVIHDWNVAFKRSVDRIERSAADAVVLACHLTLFSATRLEFYSPPLLNELLSQDEIRVTRVVVLIDDIYDMYARLSEPGDLFGHAFEEHLGHAEKLTGPTSNDEAVHSFDESERDSLAVESRIKGLMRLLHWRRAEMIAAEELARNLGVELTVLAVKHEMDALVQLVSDTESVPVYLSHKISEPRAHNRERAIEGDLGAWPPLVAQVNDTASVFRDHNVILVQPTAIDELRFTRYPHPDRLDRYSGELADRWPIPVGSIYSPTTPEAPDFRHQIDGGLDTHDRYRHGLFGLLQHTIYDEIAFRDHLLVSCNRGLLVFRPGAMGARISGGVEAEVAHWAATASIEVGRSRPSAMIHVGSELRDLVLATPARFRGAALRSQFVTVLHAELGELGANEVWDRAVLGNESLDDVERSLSSHLRRLAPGPLIEKVEAAVERALCAMVSSAVCRVPAGGISQIVHFVADSEERALASEFVATISAFLRAPTSEAYSEANKVLVSSLRDLHAAHDVWELARLLSD